MRKGLKILIIIVSVIVVVLILLVLFKVFGSPIYDESLLDKAVRTGDVNYCKKMISQGSIPGPGQNCVELVAQKNDNQSLCLELITINEIGIGQCYALYAYYKNDETFCQEPPCSKTLFNYCQKNTCLTLKDYK